MRVAAILDHLPFLRRRRPGIDRGAALAAVPVRNSLLEWSVEEGEKVVLRVPRRRERLGRILERLVAVPEYKQVVLDEVGSDVWQMCDGQTSVDGIVRALAKKYKLN